MPSCAVYAQRSISVRFLFRVSTIAMIASKGVSMAGGRKGMRSVIGTEEMDIFACAHTIQITCSNFQFFPCLFRVETRRTLEARVCRLPPVTDKLNLEMLYK